MDGFFVSCIDAKKTALILGPFRDEKLCREYAYVDPEYGGVREKHIDILNACHDIDKKSAFYLFGMVKIPDAHQRSGVLQKVDPEWDKRFKWENMLIVDEVH